jgi:L-glyceraldehyde 3-phosphate reductase
MHTFAADRYDGMVYRKCGRWSLKLPAVSLGGWQTYGGYVDDETSKRCLFRAFDLGVTHFDLANNYGEPSGNAEVVVGRILKAMPRDELIISSKAGYDMWPGPYGEWLSKKYIVASCDQSLKRLGLEYVDLFYAHRPDPETPTEEVMAALDLLVRQGKALYVGLSNHCGAEIRAKHRYSVKHDTAPIIINQNAYNLLRRGVERTVLPACAELGMGMVAFCPLAQGDLSGKYLADRPPADSRLARSEDECARRLADPKKVKPIRALNEIAKRRGQSLAQMAIAWILRRPEVTSVVIGASRPEQIDEDVAALKNIKFALEELDEIDRICAEAEGANKSDI